jgi:hypothetical protein
MTFGFTLRRLSLVGPGKKPAEVAFTRGLNVIAGPSDTGKSFIVQCLDYALGGGNLPKEIPEADGYTLVTLEIEGNSDGRTYLLERGLQGGDFVCKTPGQPDRELAAKHQGGNEDTISHFLLDLSGLSAKKVRTNRSGLTRPLSFRDIARLVIVDEEMVIKEGSPIQGGQLINETAEKGVFRLLLTGVDDSSIVASEDPKVAKGRQAGKLELLESMLKKGRERLAEFSGVSSLDDERYRLALIEDAIQAALVARAQAQASVAPLQVRRSEAWAELKAIESKFAVVSELQTRFELLHRQYESDLRRLDAIAEAGARLDQLKEEHCPVCGAFAEHQNHDHGQFSTRLPDVARACKAEALKTERLLQDLKLTQEATTLELQQIDFARERCRTKLEEISRELKSLMEQHVDVASSRVDDLRSRAEVCRMGIYHLERVREIEALLHVANSREKQQKPDVASSGVSTAQADPFTREVEALLAAWHFPSLNRVSFSEDDQDLVISGRARKSHGKGVRAITRAAFNLALLRFCIRGERPFPNFVLIDSPLLVYEEPDVDEASFPPDIKKHFWESLRSSFADAQVIIIENSRQLPSDGMLAGVNVERFTGNEQGRAGFIPS